MKKLALLFALATPSLAFSSQVIDQWQVSFDTGVPFTFPNSTTTNYPVGQSFTAGVSGLLSGINLFSNGPILGSNSQASSDTVTLGLYSYSGGNALGTLLGSVTKTVSSSISVWGYILAFDTSSAGVQVAAGSQYAFAITNVTGAGDLSTRGILGSTTNPYAGGQSINGAGYGNQPNWDLQFQTAVTTVPLPGVAWLFGSGLLGLVGLNKRKLG